MRPFPHGNGRHARLVTDLLARATGRLGGPDVIREAYLTALREGTPTATRWGRCSRSPAP